MIMLKIISYNILKKKDKMTLILRQTKGSKLTIGEMDGNLLYLYNLVSGATSGSGTSGTDGTSGSSGVDGSGTSGTDGTSGSSGVDGSGTSGTDGTSGSSGVDGSGTDGTSGSSGVDGSGTSGTDGTSGSSGVDGAASLTEGYIAFGNSSNEITGESLLFWNAGLNRLAIQNTGSTIYFPLDVTYDTLNSSYITGLQYIGARFQRKDSLSDSYASGIMISAYQNKGAVFSAGGNNMKISYYNGSSLSSTPWIYGDSNGNVAINSLSAFAPFHVSGNTFIEGTLKIDNIASASGNILTHSGGIIYDRTKEQLWNEMITGSYEQYGVFYGGSGGLFEQENTQFSYLSNSNTLLLQVSGSPTSIVTDSALYSKGTIESVSNIPFKIVNTSAVTWDVYKSGNGSGTPITIRDNNTVGLQYVDGYTSGITRFSVSWDGNGYFDNSLSVSGDVDIAGTLKIDNTSITSLSNTKPLLVIDTDDNNTIKYVTGTTSNGVVHESNDLDFLKAFTPTQITYGDKNIRNQTNRVFDNIHSLYGKDKKGAITIRIDRSNVGSWGGETLNTPQNFFSILNHFGLKGTMVFSTSAILNAENSITDVHRKAWSDGHTFELHGFNQVFWQFSNEYDSKATTDNFTVTGVAADSGTIGGTGSIGVAAIESLFSGSSLSYPNDTAPQSTDSNEDWWEYVICASKKIFRDQGLDLIGFSSLGSNADAYRPYNNKLYNLLIKYFDYGQNEGMWNYRRPGSNAVYSDNLANSGNTFTESTGITITSFDGYACAKIASGGGGKLIINDFFNNSYDKEAQHYLFKFDLYKDSISGVTTPIQSIKIHNKSTAHFDNSGVTIDGTLSNNSDQTFDNPMTGNTWYTIQIQRDATWFIMSILDISGNTVGMSAKFQSFDYSNFYFEYLFNNDDNYDTYIKNINFETINAINRMDTINSWSWDGFYDGIRSFDEHVEYSKTMLTDEIMAGKDVVYYHHELGYVPTKFSGITDNTDIISYYRSAEGFYKICEWIKTYNVPYAKQEDIASLNQAIIFNKNLVNNPELKNSAYGVTKDMIGWIYGSGTMEYNFTETPQIGGHYIVDISSGANYSNLVTITESGNYSFKYYCKGSGHIQFSTASGDAIEHDYPSGVATLTERTVNLSLNVEQHHRLVIYIYTTSNPLTIHAPRLTMD
jgi:hypothetical protein